MDPVARYVPNSFDATALPAPGIHETVFVARDASIIGHVSIEANASIWFHAVLRGDMGRIEIGENSNIQDQAVIHVDFGFDSVIGSNVSVGHSAIIHGATIGNDCIIGMHATILNGAKIGDNCLVAAGAIVMQGQDIPAGSVVMGIPAKVRKPADDAVREMIRLNWEIYRDYAASYRQSEYHSSNFNQ